MDAIARALADPIRRDILRMLRDRPLNAGEVAEAFPVSRPAISRHLRVLREAGLVQDEAVGRERVYTHAPGGLDGLQAFIDGLRAPSCWERRLLALETEVHRVKRDRRRAPPSGADLRDPDQETA